MIIAEFNTYTSPSFIETIWLYYSQVEYWKEWDHDIEYVSIVDGQFQDGSRGELKLKGGPKASFLLNDVIPKKSFTVTSQLPGATMHFYHILKKRNHDYLEIIHKVEIIGWTSILFYFLLRPKLQRGLSRALLRLTSLVAKAEDKKAI